MSVADRVLQYLREAQGPVSGEELAGKLGISRNSVWKAVQKLRQAEYEIEAATNKGYRFISESNVLSPENIRRQLLPLPETIAIDVREEVTSTNTVLKALAEKGGREGMVMIAERQSQGKGRLGRSFYSPRGNGLYMSVLLRPAFSPEESLCITTAAAVAVAESIDAVTGKRSQIKWVNDVYFRGKKVCGILTEASIDFENGKLNYAVLGIGVNLQEPAGGFPEEIQEVAGAIFQEMLPAGARTRLAAEIINRFFTYYKALPERLFMAEYQKRSLLTGMEIILQQGSCQWEGTVQGVDHQARLILRLPDGSNRAFGAGVVSVVKSCFLPNLHHMQNKEKVE